MVRLSDENEFAVICLSNDHAIKLYPNTMVEEKIRKLAAKFQQQSRITVVTGAGVSAASGVPTFRGAGGLWKTTNRKVWPRRTLSNAIRNWSGTGTTGAA